MLDAASMYVEEHGNDYLKGVIDIPQGQELIFTSIPYDEGWKVYIDGEKAETVKVLESLLAVPATVGFHEIEFVYRPISYTIGMPLTVIGILAFIGFILWSMFRKLRFTEKAGAEKTTHFFWCRGDETMGWLLEARETELANASDEASAPQMTAEEEIIPPLTEENLSEEIACEEASSDTEENDQ